MSADRPPALAPRRIALVPAALFACAAAFAQGGEAVVQQPRPFGYSVGDIATQRVLLARDGVAFEPAALPEEGRANTWLQRRAVRIEPAADGKRWLVLEYQVVNAPRALASVPVPGWELAGRAGAPPLRVPAAAISVGPLTTAPAPGEALPLRPDRPAPAIATEPIVRRLATWLAALAATLCAWLGYTGWSAWRARRTQPFAIALRQLRAAGADPAAAHLALHQAFDRTAGAVLHAGALAPLFARAPWLQPLQPQIARFYADSAALFFDRGLPADAASAQALCRALRRLERRHAP
ncbi:MAG TPA: calcium incorporation protein MxaA [Ramlibacter sp.]|uniref:calcium incorporation protein MxaA n=1 Tax=Ramlibacter sp. TaxID=1917967 RepID=UPI002D7E92E0|nr:calcium incorporation protein MxaA [Ramlibacter sp.]HET8747686.1 calcium incorporation protein MxaA [Ramlibacter sp.]